jgi:hypothetical protein
MDARGGGARRWANLVRWIRRYGPAEIAGTVAAVAAGTALAGSGPAAVAYGAALAEGVAFYGVLFARDLAARRAAARRGSAPGGRAAARTARDLVLEFGPAELLDTLAVRPFLMYLGPLLVGDVAGGVVLGKVAADLVFYAVAIGAYETRRALTRRRTVALEPATRP